ncbi:DUF2487 family protein [Paenibacillus roseipurpureus]|uniref:DUF2487 family protein n=1 Tax=Paenibacillus roseopurpureus TaxID=2918901 RepID=A0AA96LK21_9BACL|nr:DUF2487 family protein [Paenibacillus sp. MBLB1832]WNR42428.1 DUF2487 family protein [Paenibacillus sp. MBLB1832]
MKFNDIAPQDWPELKPYLDTCLLPITGLTGREDPMQVTSALEHLRDVMEVIEIPFKGRVVTYPALHYIISEDGSKYVEKVTQQVKQSGFRYVIVVTSCQEALTWTSKHTDLLIVVDRDQWAEQVEAIRAGITGQVQQLWYPVD